MAVTINWTLNAQVLGGPRFPGSGSMNVEAYDVIDITLAAGAAGTQIEVQPGGAGQVTFLMITADPYASADLSYTINGGATDIALDSPQLFIGSGVAALFGGAPQTLELTNGTSDDTAIRILVGRDATP
jgi:hypothetical protein